MNGNVDTQEIFLQWIKGDKIGNVEKIETQDGEWITFQSGSRIATELLNEFLIPIEGEPLDFKPINPDLTVPGENALTFTSPQRTVKDDRIFTKVDNPIKTLFDKQKKTDTVNLDFSIPINVPHKDIFNIINMSFDEDEVLKELNSFISNQVSIDHIKDTLKQAINELIDTQYNK